MSVQVCSGSAQLAALQALTAAPQIAPLVATVLLINARHVRYSASIQRWLVGACRPQALTRRFFLGDGNWALSMREYHAGDRDAGLPFGSGLATAALVRGDPGSCSGAACRIPPRWGRLHAGSVRRRHRRFGLPRPGRPVAGRGAGYLLMAWVPITPRVQGVLAAIPLGVMIGIVLARRSAARGRSWPGWPWWAWR